MELRYKDNQLEKLCTNEREMRAERELEAAGGAGPPNSLSAVVVTVIDIHDYH